MEKSNPQNYADFVKMIKTSTPTTQLQFPIKLSCISELERINRQMQEPICFQINVFREHPLTHKICLIRKSSYNDGKIINVLLVELEHDGKDFFHYVLIENTSFKKNVKPILKMGKYLQLTLFFVQTVLNTSEVKIC